MSSQAQRIEHFPTQQIVPHLRNPRTHSDSQIAAIAASLISPYAFAAPIMADNHRQRSRRGRKKD
jgi:hypothetical protein